MKIGQFELNIRNKFESDNGYVTMYHGEIYQVEVISHSPKLADVELEIDGESVGVWRVSSYGKIILERGAYDNGRFTFFQTGSAEAGQAGLGTVSEYNMGLVVGKFSTEEVRKPPAYAKRGILESSFLRSPTSGGTGLTGNSAQTFGSTYSLNNAKLESVISLRLICDGTSPVRPKVGQAKANPVPQPI